MQIHQLTRKNPNRKKKLVGRGGKRGTTSGRGTKGQKARSGRKLRPELRDIIKKLPKRRGYRFHSFQEKASPINLMALERNFQAGEKITPEILIAKKLIRRESGKMPVVKILGSGALTKKLIVAGCLVSASAKEKIEQAGGAVK